MMFFMDYPSVDKALEDKAWEYVKKLEQWSGHSFTVGPDLVVTCYFIDSGDKYKKRILGRAELPCKEFVELWKLPPEKLAPYVASRDKLASLVAQYKFKAPEGR
jgi:hypothetical protein